MISLDLSLSPSLLLSLSPSLSLSTSDPKLWVPFLPQPPDAQALAWSQTGDHHELADSRVSCEVLVRGRGKGVCFQIITGQHGLALVPVVPVSPLRREEGTWLRAQPLWADQPWIQSQSGYWL